MFSKRRSIRLKNYNYSSGGYYFVTICVQDRECMFGNIAGVDPCIDPNIELNDAGKMIGRWYLNTAQRFKNVILDEYQIMPNHLHGIIVIRNGNGQTHGFAPTDRISIPVGVDLCVDPNIQRIQQTLFKTIQWFKTMTTNHYIRGVKNNGWKPFDRRLWQRNYYEHIIRNETDLNKIRTYIKNNPQMWNRDRNNPKNWT